MIQIALTWFLALSVVVADTASEEKAKVFAERQQIAKNTKVIFEGNRKSGEIKLIPQPIYRYHEVVRGLHHASTWAWKAKAGRPRMILNLSGSQFIWYEFISLTNDPISASTAGRTWSPKSDGWSPQAIQGARPPGRSRVIRLSQMRSMAKKFAAFEVAHAKRKKLYHLRLLPQPIYRYDKESDESLDGALFAFVRDGDLEIILTIEATKTTTRDAAPKWVFDCDRVAIFEQHVTFKGVEVWNCPRHRNDSRQSPYLAFQVRAPKLNSIGDK